MTSRPDLHAATGPLLVLFYCFVNAVKSVYEGALVQDVSPEFLALNCFAIAQVFYLVTYPDLRELARAVRPVVGQVAVLNVTTALSWLAVLYALKYLEPAIANAVIVGVIPVLTIVMGHWLRPGSPAAPMEIVASIGVLGAMAYLAAVAWTGSSAVGSVQPRSVLVGFVACLVTAAAVVGNTFYTKRLGEAGISSRQMMACRFPLLLAATLAIVLVRGSHAPYTPEIMIAFVLLGTVGVVLAVYVLQLGITRTEPITVSLLFGSNLIMTFVIQVFDPRLTPSSESLYGIVMLSAFIVLGAWGRYRARPVTG